MLARGYQERTEAQRELVAWHACNVMNVHMKRKITVKKLLGKDKQMTAFDKEKEFEKLTKALAEREEGTDGADGS